MAVPTVFLNGEPSARAAWHRGDRRQARHRRRRARRREAPKDAFDVLVVGGGPAGAAAAVYARKGIRTGVVWPSASAAR